MLLTQSNEVIHDENLPNVMDGVCEAEGSTHYVVWSAQAHYKPKPVWYFLLDLL